jgi:hypothetical protein
MITIPDFRRHGQPELQQIFAIDLQLRLPLVKLIEISHLAVDDLIDVLGKAPIVTVLNVSVKAFPQRSVRPARVANLAGTVLRLVRFPSRTSSWLVLASPKAASNGPEERSRSENTRLRGLGGRHGGPHLKNSAA